jgi:hypothetical protein
LYVLVAVGFAVAVSNGNELSVFKKAGNFWSGGANISFSQSLGWRESKNWILCRSDRL